MLRGRRRRASERRVAQRGTRSWAGCRGPCVKRGGPRARTGCGRGIPQRRRWRSRPACRRLACAAWTARPARGGPSGSNRCGGAQGAAWAAKPWGPWSWLLAGRWRWPRRRTARPRRRSWGPPCGLRGAQVWPARGCGGRPVKSAPCPRGRRLRRTGSTAGGALSPSRTFAPLPCARRRPGTTPKAARGWKTGGGGL